MKKYEVLKGMNNIMQAMNDEDAYMEWIVIIPDGATDADIQECAEDEEIFNNAVNAFTRIFRTYSKYGLFVDGKIY